MSYQMFYLFIYLIYTNNYIHLYFPLYHHYQMRYNKKMHIADIVCMHMQLYAYNKLKLMT